METNSLIVSHVPWRWIMCTGGGGGSLHRSVLWSFRRTDKQPSCINDLIIHEKEKTTYKILTSHATEWKQHSSSRWNVGQERWGYIKGLLQFIWRSPCVSEAGPSALYMLEPGHKPATSPQGKNVWEVLKYLRGCGKKINRYSFPWIPWKKSMPFPASLNIR